MPLLPNHYLQLKQEELALLFPYTVFKVKAVRPRRVALAHGTLCFFVKDQGVGISVGDTLTLCNDLLVPKTQPLYL